MQRMPSISNRNAIASAAFGPVLRRLRRERGVSQADFSKLAGVDRTFISQLERSIRQPSLAVFMVIARTLEIDPTRLMSLTVKQLKTVAPAFLKGAAG